ncbi:hypothetical protein [Nesterenkonia pannonica]|uniref:hypothetical protein n=1 Tax=Nesterenkonia pannonica TaxID=1548602 RepID=UPI002164E2C7|nr:hypothetical protein [Nesterenkonia pannonica]
MLEAIDPNKDADGLHPMNLGRLVASTSGDLTSPLPCTPKGCVDLLTHYGLDLNGKHVVVVGRGVTIGLPIGLLLTRRNVNATVTLCHTGTKDTASHLKKADVVVAAAGVKHMIDPADLKQGVVVLDVGVTREVDPRPARPRSSATSVPASRRSPATTRPIRGVGPMTRVELLANVVESAERAAY